MTWSISLIAPLSEAVEKIDNDGSLPHSVKEYIKIGLDGLRLKYDENVQVSISGAGHLFRGDQGVHEVTSINNLSVCPMGTSG